MRTTSRQRQVRMKFIGPKRKRGRPKKEMIQINTESVQQRFPSRHHSSPMILRSMMSRVMNEEEEEKQKELTPV